MGYSNWIYNPGPYYPYTSGPTPQPYNTSSALPSQSSVANPNGIIWVDGEVGAKAYQLPAGWPLGQPIALWDTNDTVIYLKSVNPMGMPNPLQKLHYTMEDQQMSSLPAAVTVEEPKEARYVTKDDLESMKNEILEMLTSSNQNEPKNRGGNR